jgi:hypothetical protein
MFQRILAPVHNDAFIWPPPLPPEPQQEPQQQPSFTLRPGSPIEMPPILSEWLKQQEQQQEEQPKPLSTLPPGFTQIRLHNVLTAWEAWKIMDTKIDREKGETLEFVIVDPGTWFVISGGRGIPEWAQGFYRRMIALPHPVAVLLITKFMGTLQTRRIVFLLKTPEKADPYDDFYVKVPNNKGCPIDVMWDQTRAPIALYPRIKLTPKLFRQPPDAKVDNKLLYVKVGEFVLGVPAELEFLMVAYSEKGVLVCVCPGPQLLAKLEKPNTWALVFEIPHGRWEDQNGYFKTTPTVSDWKIFAAAEFEGCYRNSIEYKPEGDFFDDKIHEMLVQERLAMVKEKEVEAMEKEKMPKGFWAELWARFARCLLEKERQEAFYEIQGEIRTAKNLAAWTKLYKFVLFSELHCRNYTFFNCITAIHSGLTAQRDKYLGKWRGVLLSFVDVLRKRDSLTLLHKYRWIYRKFRRLCRNVPKFERYKIRWTQLHRKIHELVQRRLANRNQACMKMQALVTALTLGCEHQTMQLEQVQQQHAMQLEQIQQQHEQLQQQHAMQLEQLQQQLATAQQEAQMPCPEPQNCSICLEVLANTVLLPCLHLCVCNQCCGVGECPICREPITERVNTIQVPWVVCIKCTRRLPNIVLQPCGHQVLCNTCVADGTPAQCPFCAANVDNVLKTFL